MTLEVLNALLGAVLSLLLSFSAIRRWYQPLSADAKRLVVVGILALISLLSYLIACSAGLANVDLGICCDESDAIEILNAFLAAAIANQAVYALTPRVAKAQENQA